MIGSNAHNSQQPVPGFIEVMNNGYKMLINITHVIAVEYMKNGSFVLSVQDTKDDEGGWYVDESYEDVKRLIREAGE